MCFFFFFYVSKFIDGDCDIHSVEQLSLSKNKVHIGYIKPYASSSNHPSCDQINSTEIFKLSAVLLGWNSPEPDMVNLII